MFQLVETPVFMRLREGYLDDDGFAELQAYLAGNPEAGDLVPGAGDIRKCAGKIDAARKAGVAGCGSFTIASFQNGKSGC
jgi:hypothetical protein